jgi:hypothetical protein
VALVRVSFYFINLLPTSGTFPRKGASSTACPESMQTSLCNNTRALISSLYYTLATVALDRDTVVSHTTHTLHCEVVGQQIGARSKVAQAKRLAQGQGMHNCWVQVFNDPQRVLTFPPEKASRPAYMPSVVNPRE